MLLFLLIYHWCRWENPINFLAVPKYVIADNWPALSDGIEGLQKINLGTDTKAKIYKRCQAGDWLMFAMYEEGRPVVVLIADIQQGDSPIFNVGYCWGQRLDEWIDEVYNSFETIAHQLGCRTIAFNGRPGWRKLAKQYGFRVNTIVFVKEL
jgi:hypothetical protein